jgi:hypothetical protein
MQASTIQLTAAQIAFMQGNVTMYAAATGADLSPQVARATGCRVDATSNRVTIFVNATYAAAVIASVRAHRTLAVVFSQPHNHQAIQLKSHDAQIAAMQNDDWVLVADYRERMIAHISPIGFAPEMLRAFFGTSVSDIVALQFTPCAAFDQTPGPNAGAALITSEASPA